MKINDSDLKEVLKNNEIDQDKQARIIEELETREVIAEQKESKSDSDSDDQANLNNKNNAELAEQLGYKNKDQGAGNND